VRNSYFLFETYTNSQLYIFVTYWVFEVITTCGYGDFAGGTKAEYLVSIVLEFGGFIVFSIFMLLVERFIKSGFSFEQFIGTRFSEINTWITRVEFANHSKNIAPALLIQIRKNLEDAFLFDYNVIIEEFDFYQ
jgi:hypothetical protein